MHGARTADSASAAAAGESRPRLEPAALVILALLTVVWSWWAWQEGAYFGVVLLPGAMLLCVAAAVLAGFAPWPIDLRRSLPVTLAIACLAGLGVWTLLSALWSPAPDAAIADGQRVLVYALAFGLGLWLCALLGRRMSLALVPAAAGAAFAGAVTVISLIGIDVPADLLETDGTLEFPLGYRNANAAFFAIAIFPAIGLAADRDRAWPLRGVALGTATMCVEMLMLCQSRGSAPALAVALAVFLLLSPIRLRALCWLVLAALPALGMIGPAGDLYAAVDDVGLEQVSDQAAAAGRAAAITTLIAVAAGALAARFEARLPGLGATSRRANKPIAIAFGLALVAAAALFVAAVGDPVEWAGDRLDEFRTGGTPDLSEEATRFGFNAASDRRDLWEVALADIGDDPLLGEGSGGFQYSYTRERAVASQDARDAHSVELEVGAELGLIGLALLITALAGAGLGIVRSRRLSEPAGALGAVALAGGCYWLVHSSVDWFWSYPAVTAPAIALLGAACAPCVLASGPGAGKAWRRGLIAALVVLAVSAVPPFLSERYVNDAYDGWRDDLQRAYDDLETAADLNRLSDTPLLAEGAIARAAGDPERALAAFRAAEDKRPEEWATHYLLAELQERSNPRAAREQIALALELNPLGRQVRKLAERLGIDPDAPSG